MHYCPEVVPLIGLSKGAAVDALLCMTDPDLVDRCFIRICHAMGPLAAGDGTCGDEKSAT